MVDNFIVHPILKQGAMIIYFIHERSERIAPQVLDSVLRKMDHNNEIDECLGMAYGVNRACV